MSNVSKEEIIVLGIIEYKGKFLVGKVREDRLEEFGGLKYAFPGGTVEKGERLEDAVTREIEEETMLSLELKGELGNRVHPVTKKKTYYYYFVSETDKAEISLGLNDDMEEFEWLAAGEVMERMPTLFSDVKDFLLAKKV